MADNEELVSRMRHELDRDRPFDRVSDEVANRALKSLLPTPPKAKTP